MVVKTRSQSSFEEEGMEMENRAEIIKIQEKLKDLDLLKSDVAKIKNLLLTKFSQASKAGVEEEATESREGGPIPEETRENLIWNGEQIRRTGAPANFFLESNTVIPNHPSVFTTAVRTSSQVNLVEREGKTHRRIPHQSGLLHPMVNQGFSYGQGVPAAPPWTWQNTNQMAAMPPYYHPAMNASNQLGSQLPQPGWSYHTNNPGVNMFGTMGNMNKSFNSGGHQYADAVLRGPKLEIPLFSREGPIGWLEQCEKFFEMAGTPREQWVNIATGHFTGKANTWFKGIGIAWQVLDWQQLCSMLADRFSEANAHEVVERLQTMRHIGNISKYIDYFERTVELVRRDHPYLQEAFLLSCFIGGLKEEIKYGVSMHQPKGLLEAYWFARLEEKANQAKRTSNLGGLNRNKSNTTIFKSGPVKGMNVEGVDKGKKPVHESNKRNCWNCNEPWVPGHHLTCKIKKALHAILLQGEEDETELAEDSKLTKDVVLSTAPGSPEETEELPEIEQLLVISGQAMKGISGPATFLLKTVIGGKPVVLLVDSGSTMTFMDYEFAVRSEGKLLYRPAHKVLVAGGGELSTEAVTEEVSYHIQGYSFTTSFQLLNLGSYDAILRADWIFDHSPIGLNLKTRELSLFKDGKTIIFKDYTVPGKKCLVGAAKFERLLKKEVLGFMIRINWIRESENQECQELPREVQELIQQFADVFKEPKGLPPKRECDHTIPLKGNTDPPNLRSYRTPHHQRDAMESIICQLLYMNLPSCVFVNCVVLNWPWDPGVQVVRFMMLQVLKIIQPKNYWHNAIIGSSILYLQHSHELPTQVGTELTLKDVQYLFGEAVKLWMLREYHWCKSKWTIDLGGDIIAVHMTHLRSRGVANFHIGSTTNGLWSSRVKIELLLEVLNNTFDLDSGGRRK